MTVAENEEVRPAEDRADSKAGVATTSSIADVTPLRHYDQALRYAKDGYHVFPVRVGRKPDGRKDLRFAGLRWSDTSTRGGADITSWWGPGGSHEGASVCIDAGKSHVVVIDLDSPEAIAWWLSLNPPATMRARTPSGGEHWYYAEHPDHVVSCSTSVLAKDVDVRALGGFVIAAPSTDWRGAYELVEGYAPAAELPIVPDMVIERLKATKAPVKEAATPAGVVDLFDSPGRDPFTEAGARAFIEAERQKLESARGGYRMAIMSFALSCAHFPDLVTPEECLTMAFDTLKPHTGWAAPDREDARWVKAAYKDMADNVARGFKPEEYWHAEIVEESTESDNPHRYDSDAWHIHEAQKDGAKATSDKLSKLRARLHSRSGLDLITPPTPLIKGVLDVGTVAFLSGKFGTYKTFVSVAWSCSVATGRPWEGREVVTPGPVVYVAAEGVSGIKSRVRSWELAFNDGIQVPDDMLYVLEGRIRLNDRSEVELFYQLIKPLNPAMVVIDTLHACSPGAEENSSKDMGEVFDSLSALRRNLKCTVLANHHTGHAGERSRGSSAIEDDADTSWVIKLKDSEDRSPANQRTLVHRKVKDGALSEEVPIILVPNADTGSGYVTYGEVEASGANEWLVEEAILKALESANAPRNVGRDRAKGITEIKASNDVYAAAMKRWKTGWTSGNAA